MIELNTLRVFEAVARNKSFSKAAEELFMSQPAVSQQIKILEEYLEVKLFYRTAKEIIITEYGEKILGDVRDILEKTYQLKTLISKAQQTTPEKINIGFSSTAAPIVLEPLVKLMQTQYTETKLEISTASTQEIVAKLLNLEMDFAFVSGNVKASLLEKERFCSDTLVLVFSPEHPWSAKNQVTVKDLIDEQFLLREKGTGTREIIDDKLAKLRIKFKKVIEVQDNAVLEKAVMQNLGISLLPRHLVESELEHGLLLTIPVEGVSFTLEISFIYHKDKFFRNMEREIISSIAQACNLIK